MRIEIGKVLKPQGIKGELKVLPLSLPQYLCEPKKVCVGDTEAMLTSGRIHEGYGYITLDICKSRDSAETFRNQIISVDSSLVQSLQDDQYYFKDLEDCEVFADTGEYLGKVVEVENYGASDIINIHQGLTTIAVPFLREVFKSVDTSAKKIIVDYAKYREVTEYED